MGLAKRGATKIQGSVGFIEHAIWSCLCDLKNEVETRDNLNEGNPTSDSMAFNPRVTYVAAYLALGVIWERYKHGSDAFCRPLNKFMQKYGGERKIWGEGAIPLYLCTAWALELAGDMLAFERTCCFLSLFIIDYNQRRRKRNKDGSEGEGQNNALLSPYISADKALVLLLSGDRETNESRCSGKSYMLEALIKLLARRLMRQHLAIMWDGVTRIASATYFPDEPYDLWRFHNNHKGVLETKYWPQPTSWTELKRQVECFDPKLLPPFAADYPHLLFLNLLVAPHRLNPTIGLFLDKIDWNYCNE